MLLPYANSLLKIKDIDMYNFNQSIDSIHWLSFKKLFQTRILYSNGFPLIFHNI